VYAPAGPGAPAAPQGEPLKVEPKKATQLDDNKAHLVVKLPDNAKLYVDDQLLKSGPSRRSFVTPDLQPGQAYYYVLRVEIERDGKPVSQSKRVIVRAGQNIEASFVDMPQEATARAGTEVGN
jgi:uncharacterized protein (TIGR03000 family)